MSLTSEFFDTFVLAELQKEILLALNAYEIYSASSAKTIEEMCRREFVRKNIHIEELLPAHVLAAAAQQPIDYLQEKAGRQAAVFMQSYVCDMVTLIRKENVSLRPQKVKSKQKK